MNDPIISPDAPTFIPSKALSPHQNSVVAELIHDICTSHPGVTGFALKGSSYDLQTQLPGADIDISWCGEADATHNDDRMGFRKVFTRHGVLIDFSTWFWNDLSKPETANLPTAVSLARSEILWERERTFSIPRAVTRKMLSQRDWVAARLTDECNASMATLQAWREPQNRKPLGDGWDFPCHCCLGGLALLSSTLVRPPSAGRKGLMEIVACSRKLGISWFGDASLAALGATTFSPQECQWWTDRIAHLLEQAQRLQAKGALKPETELGIPAYYLAGIRAMHERGFHREAVYPLWRAVHDLASTLSTTAIDQEARDLTSKLHERLGLTDDEAISARLPILQRALERLQGELPNLLNHFFTHLSRVQGQWEEEAR